MFAVPDSLRVENGVLYLLEQRKLPQEEIWVPMNTVTDCTKAIADMLVRGAPAIGVTAAFGFALAVRDYEGESLEKVIHELGISRPTAVNLSWAIARMQSCFQSGADSFEALWKEALSIHAEDKANNREIGRWGASVLKGRNLRVLTHCNAGALATGGYGTALGVIYRLAEEGRLEHVYADETRPYLQGSRLTAWELHKAGLSYNVLCDNMAASLMRQGRIDAVVVGADRIARNGDTANKIGTYGLAVLARHHGIPFVVAAPTSTIDEKLFNGDQIPIESRSPLEAGIFRGHLLAPEPEKYLHPGFDVTPVELIDAIVTEKGIFPAS